MLSVLSDLMRSGGGEIIVLITVLWFVRSVLANLLEHLSELGLFVVEMLAALSAFKADSTAHRRLCKLAREMGERRRVAPSKRKKIR